MSCGAVSCGTVSCGTVDQINYDNNASVCRAHTRRHRVFWQQPMIVKDGEKKVGDARKVLRPHCPRRGAVEHCQPELKDLFSSYFPTFGRLQCVP